MLRKIISGGQTGADQAALDTAIKFNIQHGGFIPKGRKTEMGALPAKYIMEEMPTGSYPARTRKNIINSDATLIIAGGSLSRGTELTRKIAMELEKPCCHIDYIFMDDFEASMIVHSFIIDNRIEILNVAGPRLSNDPGIYQGTRSIVEAVIYMVELSMDNGFQRAEYNELFSKEGDTPETMDSAVKQLASILTLKTRTRIAALDNSRIAGLYFELSDYIMDKFIFKTDNTVLFDKYLKNNSVKPFGTTGISEPGKMIRAGDFAMEMVKKLKKNLEQSHGLRVVK